MPLIIYSEQMYTAEPSHIPSTTKARSQRMRHGTSTHTRTRPGVTISRTITKQAPLSRIYDRRRRYAFSLPPGMTLDAAFGCLASSTELEPEDGDVEVAVMPSPLAYRKWTKPRARPVGAMSTAVTRPCNEGANNPSSEAWFESEDEEE